MDASNAFVGSDLDIPNYISMPEGVDEFETDTEDDIVLELLKSLYGLKQSANLWHGKIKTKLHRMGFNSSSADSSLFTNSNGIIIALYVDDMLVLGRSEQAIGEVKSELKAFHPMKDYGLAEKVLGIRFLQRQDKGYLKIDQERYALEILNEFGFLESRTQSTPLSPSVQLEGEATLLLDRSSHGLFRRIVGRLTYLVIGTRADLALGVNRISQYLANPRKVHLEAAKHILRYVAGTYTFALVYRRDKEPNLHGYADSGYANTRAGRSTSAYVFFFGNISSPISWRSSKQTIVACSTTKAEYVALSEAARQAVWMRHLLFSLGVTVTSAEPTTVYEDNRGAISLAKNPVDHARTKHMLVRHHAIRDMIARGEIAVKYRQTEHMVADGFTKPLPSHGVDKFTKQLRYG